MANLRDITDEVLANNNSDIPMNKTEFYRWIKNHHTPTTVNYKQLCILSYLEIEFNYMIGREKISERMLCSLKYIHAHYVDQVMKPLWEAEDKHKEDIGHA